VNNTSHVLVVRSLPHDDVYADTARVPEQHRLNSKGKKIGEGSICKVIVGDKSKLLSLRGDLNSNEPSIRIDDITRNELGVQRNQHAAFTLDEVGWYGQFLWAWRASNPGYQIAARLGLLSVILGAAGLLLGIAGIVISLCK
jgi:hypothetical protein